jgi:hypothetical protein
MRGDKPVNDVGPTSGIHIGWLADNLYDRRTVAEIQRKVIKQSGRNPVSRLLHARYDKEKIAAWRLELNRVLHVFNVRSVAVALLSLIVPFSDRVGRKYSCSGFRPSLRCVEDPGGDQRSGSLGKS